MFDAEECHHMSATKTFGYLMIAIGAILAFVSAFENQPAEGVYLHAGMLLVGLLPYFIYSIGVVLWNSALVTVYGLALLIIHAWMIWTVRIATTAEYGIVLLVYGPLILSLLLLPLVMLAWRQPWGLEQESGGS